MPRRAIKTEDVAEPGRAAEHENNSRPKRKYERSPWIDKEHGVRRIATEEQPPCIHKPFDAAASAIPSQFIPEISRSLRDMLRIQVTGFEGAICEPGYIFQHTTRYYEVDEKNWVLIRPRTLHAGQKHKFLFHAHHFMITFSGGFPRPDELNGIADKLYHGVLASLHMEEDVAIEFFCTETNAKRIYPPLKSGPKLRYLFASEFPDDPAPQDEDELEEKLTEHILKDAIKAHELKSPERRNRNFEWIDDSTPSREGKEKALRPSSVPEEDPEDEADGSSGPGQSPSTRRNLRNVWGR